MEQRRDKKNTTGISLFYELFATTETPEGVSPSPVKVALDSGHFFANPETVDHPQSDEINSSLMVGGVYVLGDENFPAILRFEADGQTTLSRADLYIL